MSPLYSTLIKLMLASFLVKLCSATPTATTSCKTGVETITLNNNDGTYGNSHADQAIPNGFFGLSWSGFYDAPPFGEMPPTGSYSIAFTNPPFASFYVNTTTHPGVSSLTLESLALACTETVTPNGSFEGGPCNITITGFDAGNLSDALENQIKSHVVVFDSSEFQTFTLPKGFSGTRFNFFVSGGFPTTKPYLDAIVVNVAC